MKKEKKITCIVCPVGCEITVRTDGSKITEITGNECKRGEKYATDEVTDPRRTLTTTVRVSAGNLPLASVKSASTLPKGKLLECMEAIAKTQAKAPVKIGDVIVRDILGTGVDIIATSCVDLI